MFSRHILWRRIRIRRENIVTDGDFSRNSQFSRKFTKKMNSRAKFKRSVYDRLTKVVAEVKTNQKSYHMTTFWPLWKFRSKTRRDRDAAICKYYEQITGSGGTPIHRDFLGRVSEKRYFLPSVVFLSSYRHRLIISITFALCSLFQVHTISMDLQKSGTLWETSWEALNTIFCTLAVRISCVGVS